MNSLRVFLQSLRSLNFSVSQYDLVTSRIEIQMITYMFPGFPMFYMKQLLIFSRRVIKMASHACQHIYKRVGRGGTFALPVGANFFWQSSTATSCVSQRYYLISKGRDLKSKQSSQFSFVAFRPFLARCLSWLANEEIKNKDNCK